MEVAPAVERRRPPLTPAQRFGRAVRNFFRDLARLAVLSSLFALLLVVSFLAIDVPMRLFDPFFDAAAFKPSVWLTWGHAGVAAASLVAVLLSRRFGGDEAARVIMAGWGLASVAAFAEIAYLAPALEAGDFPNVNLLGAFVASSMVGQFVAAGLYDVLRGGGAWWRAPFYALLGGFGAQTGLYHLVGLHGGAAPWIVWLTVDFGLKAALAAAFLPIYAALRRKLRPMRGYGG